MSQALYGFDDFRQQLVAHAKMVVARAPKLESEASTNTSLVQPFLLTLGYDVGNPDQVRPEHHADFAEKYQNKVDYAILENGLPVIALESKKVGALLKDDRGQLRSYFNACPSVKLGILSDGLKYEFFADSDQPNMMDEHAFLNFDFSTIAKDETIDDNTLGGIAAIRRGLFNPSDVGAEAKRKLLFNSIVNTMKKLKSEPTDDFIRFILSCPDMGNKIGGSRLSQKVIDANRDVVRSAMEGFVVQEALGRFGYTVMPSLRSAATLTEAVVSPAATVETDTEELAPTEEELSVLSYTRNRLFYLMNDEALFLAAQHLSFRKTKRSFRVYYGKPNSGSIFDYRSNRKGVTLQFPVIGTDEITYAPSAEFDDYLLRAFKKRVENLSTEKDNKHM